MKPKYRIGDVVRVKRTNYVERFYWDRVGTIRRLTPVLGLAGGGRYEIDFNGEISTGFNDEDLDFA
jgi:hypothetical protein